MSRRSRIPLLSDAVDQALKSALDDKGGKGGVIAIDALGTIKFGFNTEGMYRGFIREKGKPVVLIFSSRKSTRYL